MADTWQDIPTSERPKGPASTWKLECERAIEREAAHRAENERLRRAMQAACTFCEVNAAPTAYKILKDALREPHSAPEPFPGVTPTDDD